ncbi:MAG: PAS domain-containing sensor histidine kinase [Steroidobacteraceae bacterium]|jgi:PAS domain S-box-containing protein
MDRYEQIFDYLPDSAFVLNRDWTISRANARSAELFGYERDELVGMPFETLVPTQLLQRYVTRRDEYLRALERGPMSPGMSHVGLCKDGSTFPAELSLGKALHGGQSVFLSVVRDMSERKELEAALLDAIGHEQRRLGDDLHDGLGQELTGLSLLLSAFVSSMRHGKSLQVTDLDRALDVAQHALQSCRSIARGLSPVTETQGGLIAGLRELVARLKTGSGPTLDFTTIGTTRLGLSPAASDHLYRIAQEAITNALKHAHANSIRVTLDIEAASVRLEIRDDGEGLTLPEISATGLGLRTMTYRASLLGAKLHITRLDHAGTCVVCECPQAASRN